MFHVCSGTTEICIHVVQDILQIFGHTTDRKCPQSAVATCACCQLQIFCHDELLINHHAAMQKSAFLSTMKGKLFG